MLDDAVHVRILALEQLMQPVDGFDIRIAAHLAEDGGAFDAFVSERIKFAEQGGPFDFSHKMCASRILGLRPVAVEKGMGRLIRASPLRSPQYQSSSSSSSH